MNSNKSVTEAFTTIPYTLAVSAPNGSVAKSPSKATYIGNSASGFGNLTGCAYIRYHWSA
jgi:hypothetical protein